MADAVEQLLLRFGIDLSPLKVATGDIKSTLEKLNQLSEEVTNKAKIATAAQKVIGDDLKNRAQEAVVAAKLAVGEEQKKAAAAKVVSEELRKQAQAHRTAAEAARTGAAIEGTKCAAVMAETAELQKQIVERKIETAEIQKQITELRRKRLEESH